MTKAIAAIALIVITAVPGISQQQATGESMFLSNVRQLFYEGKRSGEGYFDSDGDQMVFQAERDEQNPFYQIYRLDFNSGDINRISNGIGKTTCSFFNWANDNEILFASTHLDPDAKKDMEAEIAFRESGKQRRYSWDYDPDMDLFVADKNGNILRRLTTQKGYDAEGAFSPDGKHIIFCSNRTAYTPKLTEKEKKMLEVDPAWFGELYIMDADGSNLKRLTNWPGYDGGPFFSPSGERIIWRHFSEDGLTADIYTMDLDGTNRHQLTDFHSLSWAPYFHPSEQYVIFASNKYGFGNFELFLVDAAGEKEPVRITYTDGFDGLPVFTPDGNHLSWTSNRTANGYAQIFYADWNDEAARAALRNAPLRGLTIATDFTPAIDKNELRAKVGFLASDQLEGRMTGSAGMAMAKIYAENLFGNLGLDPVGDLSSFRQPFTFIADTRVDEEDTRMETRHGGRKEALQVKQDFMPLSFSGNGNAEGPVVFIGYGVRTPGGAAVSYDSYQGLEVKDKIVLALRGEPEGLSEEDKREVIRYSSMRYKAMQAREQGARAILFIEPFDKTFTSPGFETIPGNAGILAATVNPSVADKWLHANNRNLADLKKELAEYNPHNTYGFELDDFELELEVELEKVENEDENIMAMLPAANGSEEYILIGGHMDHLGHGETGSLADGETIHDIHNGADDNASGSATVMELAEYFAGLKKENPEAITANLIFVLWSGEELGLVGSDHFTEEAPVELEDMKAYVNFDMVGRLRDNNLILQGLGSSPEWRKMLEKRNFKAGFNLTMQDDPYVPTDAMSLYQAGVPVVAFFTGITEEYHKPTDDIETLDFDGMERIAVYAADVVLDLMAISEMPYVEVEMDTRRSNMQGFTVYLGTIPDYVAQVEGVKLSGVRPDGPAARAGLKAEDIIVKLAGKDIKDIYDYTYILSDLEPGKEVEIVIIRGGKEKKLKITPATK